MLPLLVVVCPDDDDPDDITSEDSVWLLRLVLKFCLDRRAKDEVEERGGLLPFRDADDEALVVIGLEEAMVSWKINP